MNTTKVIKALLKYSPKGLCKDVLIEQNGSPKKTIGCIIGCLAIDILNTLPKKKLQDILKDEDSDYCDEKSGCFEKCESIHEFVHYHLKNNGILGESHAALYKEVVKRFSLSYEDTTFLMEYNDGVETYGPFMDDKAIESLGETGNVYDVKEYNSQSRFLCIPEKVRKAIYDLRLKYNKAQQRKKARSKGKK